MYSSYVTAIQTLVRKRITPALEWCLESVSAGIESNQLSVRAVVLDEVDQTAGLELEAMSAAIRDDLNYIFADQWIIAVVLIPRSSNKSLKPLEIEIFAPSFNSVDR